MLCNIAGLTGKPGGHIVGRANSLVLVKNRYDLLCLFHFDETPQVLHDLVHVHHVDDTLSDRISIE